MTSNRDAHFPFSYHPSTLKDMELVNWLERKLNDAGNWSGRTTASMLTKEMLEELETCFQAIDMQTKLKIISCIPHMNPRKLSTVHVSLAALLELASKDADDWVETIADMYRDMPSATVIAPSCSNNDSHFSKTLEDMTKCFRKHLEQDNLRLSPEGHNIVSNSVSKASFGASPEPHKLFILRKKPKSFNLMNDMMRQCTKLVEASREKTSGLCSTTFPIKIRSTLRIASNDLPMKGIPTQNLCKLNSGFTNEPKKFQRQLSKREGGAKLLDICELPQSLKKRRQLEIMEERKRKQEEKEIAKRKALLEKKEKENARKVAAQQKQHMKSKKQSEKCQPELVENCSLDSGDDNVTNYKEARERLEQHQVRHLIIPNGEPEIVQTPCQVHTNDKPNQDCSQMPDNSSYLLREPVHRMHSPMSQTQHDLDRKSEQHLQHQSTVHHAQTPSLLPGYSGAVFKSTFQTRDQRAAMQRAREIAIMKQCNEMLQDANSLDQTGRQIVIAFMTGNKCNPRPELGNVITLKLSEKIEDGLAENKIVKMKVETFFQMDYQSGEWKRLRKCRLLQAHEMTNNSEEYVYVPTNDYIAQV